MDLKVYALLNAKIKELTGSGGLTQEEVEKIVTDEVAKIVADAPEDFDTLKEMSDWILSHENSAAEMNSAIQTNANDISVLNTSKVDKVAGKSLISDAEIERLANVDNYNDSSIRADIETNETNISTLAKHINGDLLDSDFAEDSTVAMTKTVPSGMSNYAAVKMIGGKTVKSRNLINTNETWYKESTSNTVTIKDSTITVTGVWYCAVPVSVKANTVYSISGTIVSGTVNARIAILSKTIGVTTLKLLLNIGYNSGTFNSGSDTTLWIALYGGDLNSGTSVYKDVQLEEGSTATWYMPYGALWNAPVESVVSTSADGTTKTTLLIPEVIKNLPDYGVEGNMVDFENGTYTHTNTITDGEVTALSTAETINISDMLMPIRIETGGTITLQNEHSLDMPNTIVYKKEVSLS